MTEIFANTIYVEKLTHITIVIWIGHTTVSANNECKIINKKFADQIAYKDHKRPLNHSPLSTALVFAWQQELSVAVAESALLVLLHNRDNDPTTHTSRPCVWDKQFSLCMTFFFFSFFDGKLCMTLRTCWKHVILSLPNANMWKLSRIYGCLLLNQFEIPLLGNSRLQYGLWLTASLQPWLPLTICMVYLRTNYRVLPKLLANFIF